MTDLGDYRFDEHMEGAWPNLAVVVTVTHLPTGRSAKSQPQSSPLKARAEALAQLRTGPPDPTCAPEVVS